MSRDAFFKHVKRHDVYSYIVEEARKKKLPFTLGKVLLFIESVLIMGGTLGVVPRV